MITPEHLLMIAIGVVVLMIWGLSILARHRGGLFRIQAESDGTRFHMGYRHR